MRKKATAKRIYLIISCFLALALVWLYLAVIANAEKQKAGTLEKGLYQDTRFPFQFAILENWRMKIKDDPGLVRFDLLKQNYEVNPRLRYTQQQVIIPTFSVLVDTTSLPIDTFARKLFRVDKSIRNYKEYYKALRILSESEKVREERALLAGQPSLKFTFQKPYMVEIPLPNNQYDIVEEFQIGTVQFCKRGNYLFTLYFFCEREFFRINQEELNKMLATWAWTK